MGVAQRRPNLLQVAEALLSSITVCTQPPHQSVHADQQNCDDAKGFQDSLDIDKHLDQLMSVMLVQDGSQITVERVIVKALLNAPDQAVQLLLDAEQRGEVRYFVTTYYICFRAIAFLPQPQPPHWPDLFYWIGLLYSSTRHSSSCNVSC